MNKIHTLPKISKDTFKALNFKIKVLKAQEGKQVNFWQAHLLKKKLLCKCIM